MRRRKNYKIPKIWILLFLPVVLVIVSLSLHKKIAYKNPIGSFSNNNTYVIKSLDVYSIQVGALSDEGQAVIVQRDLEENQVANFIIKQDGINKINSYIFMDKEHTRALLDGIRENYSDAFLVSRKIPAVSLAYDKEHSYLKQIGEQISQILDNFKQESNFWYMHKEGKANNDDYTKIIDERKKILNNLENSIKNIEIDNNETSKLRDNLLIFINNIREKNDLIQEYIEKKDMFSCEKLYINCVFDYAKFIESLKEGA
ncbi:hypothetical protein SAMN05661008_00274 [Alkalithermobacter thermoalcaliphilus JW-YL-7 = DSM 7308]|uniref:Uncharacterized protein n=1 Tax=Alkalithermobacter thermoalcaliphilus JW-YL-7 = DSM 7308 TaxID=1121328 RepID=A0A150FSM3_CLOPD|nr:hypothetical protein JWYL7_1250 [[Clostridium] paradoxum JW-YL-7 = DSM 7308]SHK44047.1 hypothetical protein SAMN05661008_00274 [[Clostridium] paradoxum JW-YL-7 = DSM 7308]